ncbi:hypothetical protein LguiB_005439 [Lonicera macranthoides]
MAGPSCKLGSLNSQIDSIILCLVAARLGASRAVGRAEAKACSSKPTVWLGGLQLRRAARVCSSKPTVRLGCVAQVCGSKPTVLLGRCPTPCDLTGQVDPHPNKRSGDISRGRFLTRLKKCTSLNILALMNKTSIKAQNMTAVNLPIRLRRGEIDGSERANDGSEKREEQARTEEGERREKKGRRKEERRERLSLGQSGTAGVGRGSGNAGRGSGSGSAGRGRGSAGRGRGSAGVGRSSGRDEASTSRPKLKVRRTRQCEGGSQSQSTQNAPPVCISDMNSLPVLGIGGTFFQGFVEFLRYSVQPLFHRNNIESWQREQTIHKANNKLKIIRRERHLCRLEIYSLRYVLTPSVAKIVVNLQELILTCCQRVEEVINMEDEEDGSKIEMMDKVSPE